MSEKFKILYSPIEGTNKGIFLAGYIVDTKTEKISSPVTAMDLITDFDKFQLVYGYNKTLCLDAIDAYNDGGDEVIIPVINDITSLEKEFAADIKSLFTFLQDETKDDPLAEAVKIIDTNPNIEALFANTSKDILKHFCGLIYNSFIPYMCNFYDEAYLQELDTYIIHFPCYYSVDNFHIVNELIEGFNEGTLQEVMEDDTYGINETRLGEEQEPVKEEQEPVGTGSSNDLVNILSSVNNTTTQPSNSPLPVIEDDVEDDVNIDIQSLVQRDVDISQIKPPNVEMPKVTGLDFSIPSYIDLLRLEEDLTRSILKSLFPTELQRPFISMDYKNFFDTNITKPKIKNYEKFFMEGYWTSDNLVYSNELNQNLPINVLGREENDSLLLSGDENNIYDTLMYLVKHNLANESNVSIQVSNYLEYLLQEVACWNWSCNGLFQIEDLISVDYKKSKNSSSKSENDSDEENMIFSEYHSINGNDSEDPENSSVNKQGALEILNFVQKNMLPVKERTLEDTELLINVIIQLMRFGEDRPRHLLLPSGTKFDLASFEIISNDYDNLEPIKYGANEDRTYYYDALVTMKSQTGILPVGIKMNQEFYNPETPDDSVVTSSYISLIDLIAEYKAGNFLVENIELNADGKFEVDVELIEDNIDGEYILSSTRDINVLNVIQYIKDPKTTSTNKLHNSTNSLLLHQSISSLLEDYTAVNDISFVNTLTVLALHSKDFITSEYMVSDKYPIKNIKDFETLVFESTTKLQYQKLLILLQDPDKVENFLAFAGDKKSLANIEVTPENKNLVELAKLTDVANFRSLQDCVNIVELRNLFNSMGSVGLYKSLISKDADTLGKLFNNTPLILSELAQEFNDSYKRIVTKSIKKYINPALLESNKELQKYLLQLRKKSECYDLAYVLNTINESLENNNIVNTLYFYNLDKPKSQTQPNNMELFGGKQQPKPQTPQPTQQPVVKPQTQQPISKPQTQQATQQPVAKPQTPQPTQQPVAKPQTQQATQQPVAKPQTQQATQEAVAKPIVQDEKTVVGQVLSRFIFDIPEGLKPKCYVIDSSSTGNTAKFIGCIFYLEPKYTGLNETIMVMAGKDDLSPSLIPEIAKDISNINSKRADVKSLVKWFVPLFADMVECQPKNTVMYLASHNTLKYILNNFAD